MYSKVKAIIGMAVVAGAAAVLQVVLDVNWTDFGVFGPAVGAALAAGIGWLKRERTIERGLERALDVDIDGDSRIG